MDNEEMITITKKEYDDLIDSEWELTCLQSAGVDNWSGYDDAMEMYNESK